MDISEFYTIETPPSSSTSKDSTDESLTSFQTKNKWKLSTTRCEPKSNHTSVCTTLKSTLLTDATPIKEDEFDFSLYDDNHTPLRRTLGNTKLKTRQDVRRFRKFLKRNYDLSSMALVDIDPDTMRNYLIHYLTSIRTRKGLKYDPETLRSYYLSIQRFLKDSNYPYCLRNSPQFSQCRDLIIQMRKEKNQAKTSDLSMLESTEIKNKRITMKKMSTIQQRYQTPVNYDSDKQTHQPQLQLDHQSNSPPIRGTTPTTSSNCSVSTKELLPSSSLPPRKRQQMKYFLEFGSPNDFILLPKKPSPSISLPSFVLSSDAYLLLVKFTQYSSLTSSSSSSLVYFSSLNHRSIQHFEQLLDESPACGNIQRSMLATLCHEWTGDIRLIHANLRPELNSFLPHIIVLNILASKYSS